jgi:hypothetical protein
LVSKESMNILGLFYVPTLYFNHSTVPKSHASRA